MDINKSVWKLSIMYYISDFSSASDSFAGTVTKAPKTIGMITVFSLNCLLTLAEKCMHLSIFFSSFFYNMMIHWDRKINHILLVLFPINHYYIWPIITHFGISLYWFVSVDFYSAIISLLQYWVHGCTTLFM